MSPVLREAPGGLSIDDRDGRWPSPPDAPILDAVGAEPGGLPAAIDRLVTAAAARRPAFVWLDVGPDDTLSWLAALAEHRLPAAVVAPFAASPAALDAVLADPRVAALPAVVAMPRPYQGGVARWLALARTAAQGRHVRVEGRLVVDGLGELSQAVDARRSHDALLAAVEEAVTLVARLGLHPATLRLVPGPLERWFDRLQLAGGSEPLGVDLSLLPEGWISRSGGVRSERLALLGPRFAIEWRREGDRELLAVERDGVRDERPVEPGPWRHALAAAFLRQLSGEGPGWLTLASHRDELAAARALTQAYLYEHGRDLRRQARQRSLDDARSRGSLWADLAAFPTARAGHRPVFAASAAQCATLARPLAAGASVLLVRAPAVDPFDNLFPPVGLAQLAAAARAVGAEVTLVDLALEPLGADLGTALASRLGSARFDLGGVSWSDAAAWEPIAATLLPELRRRATHVALGGMAATRIPAPAFDGGVVDFVLDGEAELGLVMLLRHLAGGVPASDVPGLLQPGAHASRSSLVVLPDLAWSPVPVYDGLDLAPYRSAVPGLERPFLPYQTSRGCPFACAFCGDESSHRVRERPPAHVVRDLATLCERHGVRDFFFLDNLVNVSARSLEGLLAALERAALGVRFVDCARPAGLDGATLVRLRRAGCTQLTFGVDAASDRMLAAMNKRFTLAEAERTLRDAHAAGILVVVNLITAMPGETEADFAEGLAFVDRLRPFVHGFRPMAYNYTPGSPLSNEPHRFGLWRRAERFDAVVGDAWNRHREVREQRTARLREVIGDKVA